MVTSIYNLFNVIELLATLIFGFFIFFQREETFNKVIRLITACVLQLVNIFQLPMEIQMGKPYGLTVILIVLWLIDILIISFDLGNDK